jgi:thymidylate synthase (FAD)
MSGYGAELLFAEVMAGIEGETMADKKRELIEDLLRHGHYGPFEHVQATFHIGGVSRSLMAQLTRHRWATFDVQSMRYVNFDELNPEPGEGVVAIPELGNAQVQGRNAEFAEHIKEEMPEDEIAFNRTRIYREAMGDALEAYKQLIELGTAPENARMVLPMGTKVNIVFSVNARTLMHIADMRAEADAQWEIRNMTNEVLELAKEWCPNIFDYYTREMQGRKNRLAP